MIFTDAALAETVVDGATVLNVEAGATVLDGNVLITVTEEGAACDCGRGLYCSENEQRVFSPKGHRPTIEWLAEHAVQSDRHAFGPGEQDEYDSLMVVGRRVYDQLRTQLGMGHVEAWLIAKYEFGLKPWYEDQMIREMAQHRHH